MGGSMLRTTTAVAHHVRPRGRWWATWERSVRTARRRVVAESDVEPPLVEVDFSVFNPRDYLLSHATIVGGVERTEGHPYIVTPHCQFINDNGNAWFNQVLLESYQSFLMAYNYLEHIQIPVMAKGFIIDAVAWIVRRNDRGEREKLPTVFIDILVATNRRMHPELIRDIERRNIKTLSMGTEITHFQCSRCGRTFREEDDDTCDHLQDGEIGQWFTGRDGKRHRQAEMCGVPGKPGTNVFSETSWVGVPAFEPAVRHGGLVVGETATGRPLRGRIPRDRHEEVQERLARWR